jgi:subfamily B ATP-binding cassette protein MsbA
MAMANEHTLVYSTARTLLRASQYIRPYRWRFLAAAVSAIAVAGLTGFYAWLVRPFFDDVLIQRNHALLLSLALSVLLVALVRSAVTFWHLYLLAYIEKWVIADLRDQLFIQLIRLPSPFHDSQTSGRLVSRIAYDTAVMGGLVPFLMKNVLQQAVMFVTMMGVAFYQNPRLPMVLLVVTPVVGYAVFRIGKRLRRLSKKNLELSGDIISFLTEAFSGIRLLKSYGREETEGGRFHSVNARTTRLSIKLRQLSAMAAPLVEVIGSLAIGGVMWYGGTMVLSGEMTPGALFSFMAALVMAYSPVRKLASSTGALQETMVAADRVFDILDREIESSQDLGRVRLEGISDSLAFRGVTFCYDKALRPALQDVTFSIRAGGMTALVGHSGSGKTTLVQLIPRLYEPTSGAIFIDGRDIREMTLTSLRRQIAFVLQETFLFDDTVRNNVAYGRVEATDSEIVVALQAAYAWEFVQTLPQGLETMIGERGIKLSGGQRQRLAIARAILRDASLLILDEATSSLDSESELMVQRALVNLMKDRTTLVIAHRLSTVQRADRLVVLDQGLIVAEGSHDELLERSEIYRGLFLAQFQAPDMPTSEAERGAVPRVAGLTFLDPDHRDQ